MNNGDLRMQFELTRQSIATWSTDAARFVAAASLHRQTGEAEDGVAQEATRTLWAVREEMSALSAASRSTADKDEDLIRGIETALAELGSLDRQLAESLSQLAPAAK